MPPSSVPPSTRDTTAKREVDLEPSLHTSRGLAAAASSGRGRGLGPDDVDGPLGDTESLTSVLSSQSRSGRWDAPEYIQVRAVLGSVKLDFSRARLPPSGEIEIDATTVMGAIEIVLPPGAELDLSGRPVLGSIVRRQPARSVVAWVRDSVIGQRADELAEDAPAVAYFSVRGDAILGSIEVIAG